ncbi:glycosyltransferase family 8 protein Ecym_5197 [Eremothecium cymbalariae DBVPG|uniref:Glycosyltransferase family 8 protein n=1 Tax=Eremothecium cymbalariae (strain CBS 270.75 / DBVPG 7215 / KCTC 17166 / NRRL Y-17582) TaxID=931890 RepID=I6ND26_ERECY|nr:hypothetical protein Ecym_5197 [Eremothecium cymbalariae DBVPG\
MTVGIVTLLYAAEYLPGVFTLGYRVKSLMSCFDTDYRLVLLITPNVLREASDKIRHVLEELYEDIVEIDNREVSSKSVLTRNRVNLELLDRPELAHTFHKLQLWKLTQFEKVLYLDSDVYPLRTSFYEAIYHVTGQTETQLLAAPDCGWPDLFNSGVMVLVPSMKKYEELLQHLDTALSIDGADQGLLNLFFNESCHQNTLENEWVRLPYLYNVTVPTVGYQATPAVRFFENKVSMVHFIGNNKPWVNRGQGDTYKDQWWSTYNEFLDKHFHEFYHSTENLEQQLTCVSLTGTPASELHNSHTWDATKGPPLENATPEAYLLNLTESYNWNAASPVLLPDDNYLPIPAPSVICDTTPRRVTEPGKLDEPFVFKRPPVHNLAQPLQKDLQASPTVITNTCQKQPSPVSTTSPEALKLVFPWESYKTTPTRVFPE